MENSKYKIITVSGRIGAGSTTLAKSLAKHFSWKHLEGGEIFWEAVRKKLGLNPKDTNLRPDEEDRLFDAQLKKILHEDSNIVLETKLAAFNAQGISGIYKILLICSDKDGADQTAIRIDRLVNREEISVDMAKKEVLERETNDLSKWRKLYAQNDNTWTYYDPKYYDLVINTYDMNQDESFDYALKSIKNAS
jgi:predicted cytidylate kinase